MSQPTEHGNRSVYIVLPFGYRGMSPPTSGSARHRLSYRNRSGRASGKSGDSHIPRTKHTSGFEACKASLIPACRLPGKNIASRRQKQSVLWVLQLCHSIVQSSCHSRARGLVILHQPNIDRSRVSGDRRRSFTALVTIKVQ